MKQKYILGIVALSFVAILGVGMISAFGFGNGFFNQDLTDEEKAEMKSQREALQTAISDGDYETWKSLMEERIAKMQESLTEENFNKIVEQQQEMKEKQEEMKEKMEQFCEENDCPITEDGEFGFGEHRGLGGGMNFRAPFAEPASE